jgi:hypothetical protein
MRREVEEESRGGSERSEEEGTDEARGGVKAGASGGGYRGPL